MISKLIGNEGSNIVLKIYFPHQLIYSQKYIPLIKDSTLKQKTFKQLVPSSKLCKKVDLHHGLQAPREGRKFTPTPNF